MKGGRLAFNPSTKDVNTQIIHMQQLNLKNDN